MPLNPLILKQYDNAQDRSSEYDLMIKKRNPLFDEIVRGTKIVRDFIIERNLIVYGGTTIDCLLRLKGSKLYPDDLLEIADLDFISPNSVDDAYDLCDILYKAGFKNVRCLQGRHVQTMRVDIEDANYIADIAYCPLSLFKKIKYATFENMRIVTADMQKIDIHSSFMLPYGNPGAEVVFQRWSKDLKRFNLLEQYYPALTGGADKSQESQMKPGVNFATREVRVPREYLTTTLAYGYFAYACLLQYFKSQLPGMLSGVIDMSFTVDKEYIIYQTPLQRAEILTANIGDVDYIVESSDKKFTKKEYRAYREYLLPRWELDTEQPELTIYNGSRCLITYNSLLINEKNAIRYVNVQGLLKYLMSQHFIDVELSDVHLAFYNSVRTMIQLYESKYNSLFKNSHVSSETTQEEHIENSWKMYLGLIPGVIKSDDEMALLPSIKTYGNENKSDFVEKILNDLDNQLYGEPKYNMPMAYSPFTFTTREMPRPTFNYNVEFFNFDGSLIVDETKDEVVKTETKGDIETKPEKKVKKDPK